MNRDNNLKNDKNNFLNFIETKKQSPVFKDIFYITLLGLILLIFVFSLDVPYYLNIMLSKNHNGIVATMLIISIFVTISSIFFSYHRHRETKSANNERRKAENQREKSKEQLQAVLDGVPDIILQLDTQTRILWANRTASDSAPELIGQLCHEAFKYEKGTFIDSYSKWAMEGKQIEEGIQYQTGFLNNKGGSYWEIIGVPLVDKADQLYGAIAIAREITSRMRIEHTWNLLSSVVESTDDAIYGLSLNGTVISWNHGAEQMYYYRQNEIIGESINKMVLPLEWKSFYQVIEKVMRTEKLDRFETTRIRKDGSKILVLTTICPFVDATGRKVGVSAIEKDITESKLYQEKLLESENFNRTIISSVKEGIAVYNSSLRIIRWNKSMEEITGIAESEVINKLTIDIFPDSLQDDMVLKLSDALAGNTVMFQDIFLKTPARKDGGWYNITFSPHINTNAELIGVIATYRDITQSKIAEVALSYSEDKYRQLVENVSEAITNIAIDGTVLFVNEVAANLVNLPSDKIVGKLAMDLIPKELRKNFVLGLNNILLRNQKQIFDFTIELPEGKKSFFISAQPVISSAGEIMSLMCLITDITDRKNAEKELEHSREQLRNLAAHLESVREDERKEIAFEVHDELGQELTALKLDLSWVETKLIGVEPKIKDKIVDMKNLIDITIDRVGNISTKLRPDILDHFGLMAAIEWVTGDFQKRSGISCELIFEPDEINVYGNTATVIFRILQETLTNVIRHSKADIVEVLFREFDNKYELFVKDNGVGIRKEQISAPNSFGLFAMNERARSVGGFVEIEGIPNKGTEIRLSIPKQSNID